MTLAQQQFDMQALLKGDIDAAQAMIYNEYAQVLEAKNPKTGKLYPPADFNRIDWNTEGTAMLQDAIWANTDKLQNDKAYQDTTVKFLQASFKGWAYCRDNPEKCRDIVVARGSKLGASHQLWQMNEINKLIWPSPKGIGMVDKSAWDQTVKVASSTKNADGDTVLTKAPEGLAYTNDYAQKALQALKAGERRHHRLGLQADHGEAQSRRRLETRAPSRAGAWRRGPRWRRSAALSRGDSAFPVSPRVRTWLAPRGRYADLNRVRARSGRAVAFMKRGSCVQHGRVVP